MAVLLNLVPGLGTGYIYQRRWRAYWITSAISTSWFVLGLVLGQPPEQLSRHLRREAASALLRFPFRRRLRHASLKPSPQALSSGSCALRVAA